MFAIKQVAHMQEQSKQKQASFKFEQVATQTSPEPLCSLSPSPSEDGCGFTVRRVFVFSLYDSRSFQMFVTPPQRVGSTVRCVSLLYL